MAIRNELVEELLAGRDPSEVFTSDGLLDELKKALAERMLNAELDQHLASERAGASGEAEGPRNYRNGSSRKTVLTGTGKLELQVPRDRQASFEPQLIAKYRRRFPDFDKVVSLYARGMHSLAFASWKERREVAAALKPVYRAPNAELALKALEDFAAGLWGARYPAIAPAWRLQWEQVIPFYAYPLEVRRMIYTTNAVESLNSCLRKAVRLRGHSPTDEAAAKLLFLALREVSRNWKMPAREWSMARTQFAVIFGDRSTAG